MKISVISGSHRQNAQSLKVAQYIQSLLDSGISEHSWLFSLTQNPLPLWDEGVWLLNMGVTWAVYPGAEQVFTTMGKSRFRVVSCVSEAIGTVSES